MLFEITSSPQLSVAMLAGLVVGCWFVWDLAQATAESIVERFR
jgi:predicted membrane protein